MVETKKLIVLHGFSEKRVGPLLEVDEAFWRYAGNNTGNLIYRHALHRVAFPGARSMPFDVDILTDSAASEILLSADVVVVPMANILRDVSFKEVPSKAADETRFVRDLGRCLLGAGKAMLLVSLGYDGKQDVSDAKMDVEQIDMVSTAAASAGLVVLRGPRTAKLLSRHGLHPHVMRPLGCPSALLIQAGLSAGDANPKLGLCLPANLMNQPKLVKDYVKRMARHPNVVVFLQDKRDVVTARNLGCHSTMLWHDPELWFRQLPEVCGAVLSFRIHGAFAALAAGVPTAIVALGHRIKELASIHKLPQLEVDTLSSLEPENTLVAIRSIWVQSIEDVVSQRDSLRRAFSEVLADVVAFSSSKRPHPAFETFDAAAYRAAYPRDTYLAGLSDFGTWYNAVASGLPLVSHEDARLAESFPHEGYIEANPDLIGFQAIEAYVHFRDHGLAEGRFAQGLEAQICIAIQERSSQAARQRTSLDNLFPHSP